MRLTCWDILRDCGLCWLIGVLLTVVVWFDCVWVASVCVFGFCRLCFCRCVCFGLCFVFWVFDLRGAGFAICCLATCLVCCGVDFGLWFYLVSGCFSALLGLILVLSWC